jgi:hypothetical protein
MCAEFLKGDPKMKNIPCMNRRQFLKAALVVTGSVSLVGCGLTGRTKNASGQNSNYYISEQNNILGEVDKLLGYVQKVTSNRYGNVEAQSLSTQTRGIFEQYLPGLPYIGGGDNDLTVNLYQAALCLAFYRCMVAHHKTLDETGEVIYRTIELEMADLPLAGLLSPLMASPLGQNKLREEALLSQQRIYPDDWVFYFVEGDGVNFDYGINYTECGICKYLRSQNAFELVPCLCLLDFPYSAATNDGLVRTTTLGHGGTCCDFRYKSGRTNCPEWTPPFLQNVKSDGNRQG